MLARDWGADTGRRFGKLFQLAVKDWLADVVQSAFSSWQAQADADDCRACIEGWREGSARRRVNHFGFSSCSSD